MRMAWLPLLFAVFTAAVLAGSRELSPVAGTTPGIIAGLTLALLAWHFVRQVRAGREAAAADRSPDGTGRRADWMALAWLALLCSAVWALGLAAGLFAFCLGMLRFQFGESWRVSIGAALVVGLGLQAVFLVLGLPFYTGLAGALLP